MTPNKFQHAGLDWISHTPGDPMPCLGHVEVRIFQRCDAKSSRQELEVSQEASSWDWSDCGASSIIGWHPIEEQPSLANLNAIIEQQAETLKVMNDALKEAHRIFGNLSHSQVVQRLCPDFAEVAELVRKSHDQHA